jgi:hypothetical protein
VEHVFVRVRVERDLGRSQIAETRAVDRKKQNAICDVSQILFSIHIFSK